MTQQFLTFVKMELGTCVLEEWEIDVKIMLFSLHWSGTVAIVKHFYIASVYPLWAFTQCIESKLGFDFRKITFSIHISLVFLLLNVYL